MGRAEPTREMRAGWLPRVADPTAPVVRSFSARRRGRMSARKQAVIDQLWPVYGLPFEASAPAAAAAAAATVVEIGFGSGEAVLAHTAAHPDQLILAIEVHSPGTAELLAGLAEHGLANVWVVHHDAVEVLESMVAPASLDRVHLFFPDPWPKARHHSRRLVQAPFVDILARRVRSGGVVHVATDWPDYADQIEQMFVTDSRWELASRDRGERPVTRYDAYGTAAGRTASDQQWIRTADPAADPTTPEPVPPASRTSSWGG